MHIVEGKHVDGGVGGGVLLHGDGVAGQRGIIAAVEAAVQLVVRIARLGIEGAGAALVGVAAGVRGDLPVVAAALTGVIDVGTALSAAIGNGVGFSVLRAVQGRVVQQLLPLCVSRFLQHVVDQIGLRGEMAPLGIYQQILLDSRISGGKGDLFPALFIEPAAKGILMPRRIGGIGYLAQRGAVIHHLRVVHQRFIAGGLVRLHVLPVLEQADGICHRLPFRIQADIVLRHGAAGDVLTAREAAGGGVPAAQLIRILFQRLRIGHQQEIIHPAIQIGLIQHVIVLDDLVVVLRRECVAVPVVVEIGGVGFAPVGQWFICLRFAAADLIPHTGKARQGRVCLMPDGRVVIVGKDGVVEHIIPRHPVHCALCHALILLMARQHLHIELIDPLAGNAPAHVGAVVEKAQKVHRARIAPLADQLFGIEQVIVQHRIQALDGGVDFFLRVLHVVLAVPSGEVGVVAPAVVVKVT